jgi:hypothetical protein
LTRLLIVLFVALTLSIMFSNCSDENSSYDNISEEPREDYGCVHDNHSRYDDGDSLNLEAASHNL